MSVCKFSLREGVLVKRFDKGIVILASCKCHFIRIHENLVQHTNNIISIITTEIDWSGIPYDGCWRLSKNIDLGHGKKNIEG